MKRDIVSAVKSKYGKIAQCNVSSKQPGVRSVAKAFGYSAKQLASIPAEANLGVSCGNPTAFASLKPGETVVDLGCGGGLDVLLAAPIIGSKGKAIGIDMTDEMLELARRNAAKGIRGKPVKNVEFHRATIDKLPLPNGSVDCVISNCVINLAPDKPAVFREIVRVLKPGGRLAVSDIALKKPLPDEIGENLMAYVGCIAGAELIDDYRKQLLAAGFAEVDIVESGSDLNAYTKLENQSCCGSISPDDDLYCQFAELLRRYDVNDFAASVRVYALKPKKTARPKIKKAPAKRAAKRPAKRPTKSPAKRPAKK
jgi:SAM-dependent methyltransferase